MTRPEQTASMLHIVNVEMSYFAGGEHNHGEHNLIRH